MYFWGASKMEEFFENLFVEKNQFGVNNPLHGWLV